MLLVSEDGRSYLHRIPPCYDPASASESFRDICEVVGDDTAGARVDCRLAPTLEELQLAAQRSPDARNATLIRRFQEGSLDEISFAAPELAPLGSLLVGPESGTWLPEEVLVASSRSGTTSRFVAREGSVCLIPVP